MIKHIRQQIGGVVYFIGGLVLLVAFAIEGDYSRKTKLFTNFTHKSK